MKNNIRFNKELVRSQTPHDASVENLCPRARLIMGLLRSLLPESPEYQVCRAACQACLTLPEATAGSGTTGCYGAHISFQGKVCSTRNFLLSAGITAAQTLLSVQQFMDVFSPRCVPGSSFPVLDSFLLFSPSPFSRASVRNGSCSSWRSINAVERAEQALKNDWWGSTEDQDLCGCVKGQQEENK